MKITFHGAARAVTGSKHVIELNSGKKILLDCGMYQGMGKETTPLNNDWGFDPATINHVIVSHAHIDHVGLLPKLVKDGYTGKIYCTPSTESLAKLLMLDSAHIQEADIAYVNKHRKKDNKPLLEPLYTEADALNVYPLFETIGYDECLKLDKGVEFSFTNTGHILGSAAVNLVVTENNETIRLTFSGDVGRYHNMLLQSPENFPQADYILVESTYGDRLHDFVPSATDKLLEHIVNTCLKKKGKLVIPAFSLGRTQEILYMLNQLEQQHQLPDLNYYVDSPLSIKVTEVTKRYPDQFNGTVRQLLRTDKDVFDFKGLKYIDKAEDSIALNDTDEPCVIISASGMAEAGRVKHHIVHTIEDPKNTILLTGYCEPRSLGGRLKQHPKEVHIFGRAFEVRASVHEITSLSAHGDYNDLLLWLSCQDAGAVKKLFLVHGEYEAQLNFKERLHNKGFKNIEIPTLHQTFELS